MVSFPMRNRIKADGRSSTSSHYSKDYGNITAGVAAADFYGIPLWNDLSEAPTELLIYLILLIILILLKPQLKPLSSPGASLSFWILVLAIAYGIREVALYPLLSTVIFTRTSYPYLVVLPHCIMAAAAYRKERSADCHYMTSFWLGFFCYGFGGSILSDFLMGLPVTAIGHVRIIPCYMVGWFLVWCSPFDIVFRLINEQNTFVYYFLNACEAVDAVTTPMGRVSRSARELNNKHIAPILAGLFAGAGGAAIRYAERIILRKGGEGVEQESRKAMEASMWRTLGYAFFWWFIAVHNCTTGVYEDPAVHHCHEYNGHNLIRFCIVVAHVVWNLACDLTLARGHPFVWLSQRFLEGGALYSKIFSYGPQPMANTNANKKSN